MNCNFADFFSIPVQNFGCLSVGVCELIVANPQIAAHRRRFRAACCL